jgi:hypothetical protein
MSRTPMPSPRGTNLAGAYLPSSWGNPIAAYDAAMPRTRLHRLAQDSLTGDDALALVRILLTGLPPDECAAFRDGLTALLQSDTDNGSEPDPTGDNPPSFRGMPRPGGGQDRRYARDSRLPAGVGSFAQRFPNAAKVSGSATARSRSW